ncbi:MAG: ribonuclease HII [Anaerolineae bacterium]|nr:ribonuclease HII [Anaerolineae bacterium]
MGKKFDRSLIPEAPNLQFEQALWQSGVAYIAGIDEAGRGCLAGPVTAAAVILPNQPDIEKRLHGVRDSKELNAKSRQKWRRIIPQESLAWGVGFADAQEVDEFGIVPATRLAAMRAIAKLKPPPEYLLIDHISIPGAGLPETSLVKGDARSLSIAAASVLAKVERDALMVKMEKRHPGYGFANNKGYGTRQHRDAIKALGACPIHRQSFAPLRVEQD